MIRSPDIDKIIKKKPHIEANFEEGMSTYVKSEGNQFLKYAKMEAPYKSGKLRDSINVVLEDKQVTIDTTVGYADFVYAGTKAHTITSKYSKVLHFNGVFAKSVNIPAIPANPYLDKTWNKHANEFVDGLEIGAIKVIEEKVL